jgi:hypothetical protein
MSPKTETPSPAANEADPTPVDPEHILNMMRSNFPEPALEWVKHAHWVGPVRIPWDRVDTQDEKKWAASHQPGAVARFKRKIKRRNGLVKPSILIQEEGKDKAVVIDGHHRALAHHQLNMPVRAYVGTMSDPKWIAQALEAHSKQEHSGSSPMNKSAQTPVVSTVHHPLGTQGLWHTPSRKVPAKQQLPAYFQNTARALMRTQGMDESQAIATAINAVKAWAQGHAFGGKVKVTPEVRRAAQAALDEWEKLKASHH